MNMVNAVMLVKRYSALKSEEKFSIFHVGINSRKNDFSEQHNLEMKN